MEESKFLVATGIMTAQNQPGRFCIFHFAHAGIIIMMSLYQNTEESLGDRRHSVEGIIC